MAVFRCAVENISGLWPQLDALFSPLVSKRPTHTMDDVRRMLLGQACQLWVQWERGNPELDAAAVTEFAAYPRGVWVRVWLAAARPGVAFDEEGLVGALDDWRVHHNCRGFEEIGRIGWLRRLQRRFPNATFEGAVMRWTEH